MKDILSKFKNGEKLCYESSIFNNIIQAMYHGGLSEYDAIEHLVNMIESRQKEDIETMRKSSYPSLIVQCNADLIGCPLKEVKR